MGTGPWITLIERLEFFGSPGGSADELARHGSFARKTASLPSFATSFFGFGRGRSGKCNCRRGTGSGRSADKIPCSRSRSYCQWSAEAAQILLRSGAPNRRNPACLAIRCCDSGGTGVARRRRWRWLRNGIDSLPSTTCSEELRFWKTHRNLNERQSVSPVAGQSQTKPHDAWAWREPAIELESPPQSARTATHAKAQTALRS